MLQADKRIIFMYFLAPMGYGPISISVYVVFSFNLAAVPFLPIQPYVDYFTHETMTHPLTNKPTPKRSFVPSKWENQKVGIYVCKYVSHDVKG